MSTMEGTRAYELRAQPTASLSQRVLVDMFALLRSETQITVIEIERKATVAAAAGRTFGVAALLGIVAAMSLAFALVAGLALIAPAWLAALIVAVVFALPALVMARTARRKLAEAGGALPLRALDGLWIKTDSSADEPGDAQRRAEAARRDLDRTLAALAHKASSPSPIRDAILSDMTITLGTVLQASKGRR